MSVVGHMPDGAEVRRLTLAAGDLTVSVLTLGTLLGDVRLAGVPYGLTLGAPDFAPYLGPMRFFGPVIGPVANRIGGAAAMVDGRLCRFEANFGPHTLHSGGAGTHAAIWTVERQDAASAVLAVTLPDGDGGFPGTRRLEAEWRVSAPATLDLAITAETDAPTLMMVAHHPYWNLDGTEDWEGHALQVDADRYLPADALERPTGEVRAVHGTEFDFRVERALPRRAFDNTLCLSDARRDLAGVARLTGRSGLGLAIATTEPGLHLYDGRGIDAAGVEGHDGRRFGPCSGLALEPQSWPDATSYPHFPDITLRPGQPWRSETRYRFFRR